ncbi:unnamed protein product [Caenorhabditis bovis]|uniref:T20D4.11-like domain-containing protein n=1 Tax=Caenorhabditis bovis TaxID=2654633 RepID=A0A8S1E9C6_9PELO|nr:unnamed protein product [Caenorhabditis bovis]
MSSLLIKYKCETAKFDCYMMITFRAIQYACWTSVIVGVLLITAFFSTIWETIKDEAHYCGREQIENGAKCAELSRNALDTLDDLNITTIVLKPVSQFQRIANDCRATMECLETITCREGHDFALEVLETIPFCEFFRFYTGEFAECADKLAGSDGDYACLFPYYKAKFETNSKRCRAISDNLSCVESVIENECSTELSNSFTKKFSEFQRTTDCDDLATY